MSDLQRDARNQSLVSFELLVTALAMRMSEFFDAVELRLSISSLLVNGRMPQSNGQYEAADVELVAVNSAAREQVRCVVLHAEHDAVLRCTR